MLIQKYFHDIVIGVEAIFANKLKSMLTALGIIFRGSCCNQYDGHRERG